MKIQLGRYYRTREGKTVQITGTITRLNGNNQYEGVFSDEEELGTTIWRKRGRFLESRDSEFDLMEEILPSLDRMTWELWSSLSGEEQMRLRDNSQLNPQLLPFLGREVMVHPARPEGCLSRFRVGRSTGWRPVLLAMKKGQDGSSDIIGPGERFDLIEVVR